MLLPYFFDYWIAKHKTRGDNRMSSTNRLRDAKLRTDPLADNTVAAIMGHWNADSTEDGRLLSVQHAEQWARLRAATQLMREWTTNESIQNWKVKNPGCLSTEAIAALENYVREASKLPDWADTTTGGKIDRAEDIFFDFGAMSCIFLFCASLPECYYLPDLSAVLHMSGQLEDRTDHRIRSTAAMIFPVMLEGGLTTGSGSGVAQIIKVRLIHATIRHMILRGNPQDVIHRMGSSLDLASLNVPPLQTQAKQLDMFEAMYANGWDISKRGLPCNQAELSYTLLTFNLVYLRCLRQLGIPLNKQDEQAYIHIWNVMAHILGVDEIEMRHSYEECHALFEVFQSHAELHLDPPDARPLLGGALVKTIVEPLPLKFISQYWPPFMMRYFCSKPVAKAVGVYQHIPLWAYLLFSIIMSVTRSTDTVIRLIIPNFSLARLFSRIVGYRMMSKLLMDQTRPLVLPEHLASQMNDTMDKWAKDGKAPSWMGKVENKLASCSRAPTDQMNVANPK